MIYRHRPSSSHRQQTPSVIEKIFLVLIWFQFQVGEVEKVCNTCLKPEVQSDCLPDAVHRCRVFYDGISRYNLQFGPTSTRDVRLSAARFVWSILVCRHYHRVDHLGRSVSLIPHVAWSTRNGAKLACNDRIYWIFWRQHSYEVTVFMLRVHCFGALCAVVIV